MSRSVILMVALLAAACSHAEPAPIVAEPPVAEAVVSAKVKEAKPAGVVERVGPDTADAMQIPKEQDCFALYYDEAGTRDLRAARACFARAVAREGGCRGDSPSLQRFYLVTMAVDGQGGPVERDHSYLDDCHREMAVEELQKLSRSKPTGKLDFCHKLAGSTYDFIQCDKMMLRQVQDAQSKLQAQLQAKHGHAELLEAAFEAAERFSRAEADWSSDKFRGGTLGSVAFGRHLIRRGRLRNALLREILAGQVKPGPGGDSAAAYAAEQSQPYDAQGRRILSTSQSEWQRYLQAELAWVRAVGSSVAAVEQRLKGERAEILIKERR